MSYRALYRQYRPVDFNEMIGQEHITTILKNQVAAGQTAHAYIFAGTRGTGKTSAAKILARAVNCLDSDDGNPCGVCEACKRTARECPDIIELDAASNNGIDDIREIIEKARFMPLELSHKVYIIDEAHGLSQQAFNALLKTLEEPPAHVLFILATTEPHKIPATIISRCQRMDFHRLSVADMVRRTKEILVQIGAEIEEEGMLTIARAAEGGMRDCLSLADQCLSFCGNNVSAEDVYSVLGSMDEGFMFDMSEAIIDSDPKRALLLLDRVVREGRDMKVFLHDLALHMRALLITKMCGHCSDILDCTEDAMRQYMGQAEKTGETRLLRASEILLQTEGRLRNVTLPRALIESTIVRIARPEEKRTMDDLLERVEVLEKQVKEGVRVRSSGIAANEHDHWDMMEEPPMPEEPPILDEPPFEANEPKKTAAKPASAAKRAEQPAASAASAGAPPEQWTAASLWKAIYVSLSQTEKHLGIAAIKGKPASLKDKLLVVNYDNGTMYNLISNPAALDKLRAVADSVAPGYRVELNGPRKETTEDIGKNIFGSSFRMVD